MERESSVRKQAKFSRRILYSSRRILNLLRRIFLDVTQRSPKETKGGALRDIQKMAAKETREFSDFRCLMNTLTVGNMGFSYSKGA